MNRLAAKSFRVIGLAAMVLAVDPVQAGEADCGWFGFNAGPEAQILDYKYGSSGLRGTYSEPGNPVPREVGFFDAGMLGKGASLSVRWRNTATGGVFSQDVVLKGHLPDHDSKTCMLYFAIKRDQLYVFVMTQEIRPADFPVVDSNPEPIVTNAVKVYIVYPYGKRTVD